MVNARDENVLHKKEKMRTLLLIIILLQLNVLTIFGQETNYLNKIDLNDNHPNYEDFGAWVNDTITSDSWKIEYLIKNDHTKYDNLYIKISKGNLNGIIKEENVLNFRKYFIPAYEGENSKYLFFTFASDTYTNGILIVDKKQPSNFKKKKILLKSDFEKGYLFFINSKNEDDQFEIGYFNIIEGTEEEIKFKGVCLLPIKTECVKNILEEREFIEFECHLKNIDNLNHQVERKTIRLNEK